MSIHLICGGGKQPDWVLQASHHYARRLQGIWAINVTEASQRPKDRTPVSQRLLASAPAGSHIVALDARGQRLDSTRFAHKMETWLSTGKVCFLIGDADGLTDETLKQSHTTLSLGELTYAHGLARIVLVEQIYRAWCILHSHPYHKGHD